MEKQEKSKESVNEADSEIEPISASGYLRSGILRRDKDYPDYKED